MRYVNSPERATFWLALLLLSAVQLGLSGCAGTAKGRETSVYSRTAPAATTKSHAGEAVAQVIIRYPAMIQADAESFYVSSFAINGIGGQVPYAQFGKPNTTRIAQAVIAKSGYYAMSLYQELKRLLPEGSVLLSPHIIVWDEKRGLYSRPIIASEQIPAVLTVDFNVYSFPDVNEMMESPPVTFGDLVTPLFVVKSSRWVQPALNGLLIASTPLIDAAWRQAGRGAAEQMQARLQGTPETWDPALDFVAYLAERDQPAVNLPLAGPREGGTQKVVIEQYPVEKIQMDGTLVGKLAEDHSVDPFTLDFVRGASARILELLNGIDQERATFFALQSAVARFDPELADVFFVQSDDESVRARLQLAEALVAAERKFLAAQTESIYQGTFEGDYGQKMRKIIEAEYRMLEERRHLAHVQNVTSAVAALALAGSVYGATVTTTASSVAVATFSGVSLLGSMWAMNRALDTKTESQDVGQYFIARMAPAFERQMSVQMEWLESKEIITARGFAEFRNKTLTLYQSRVRSLQIQAGAHCSFDHPDFDEPGRWYGQCGGGLGQGRGYGVVSDGHGDSVEYVGEARAGLASGTGAMIVRHAGQSPVTYFEGSFSAGLPDGAVRVETAAEGSRLREYRNGRDVGRGDPRDLQRLSFAPTVTDVEAVQP